ncbi:tetratricopeptide repeat protein [Chryseolinea sp. H1M3-3]|uniref:tetratricopeptide repeat protein n=1 Tax=Chryseolinea sp. H1M3-3 TaxID=3034144 RepID=UPI0023ECFED3|nr:tetratricopeptide repeat protein [Chryseolinea sp. H1M3-3]
MCTRKTCIVLLISGFISCSIFAQIKSADSLEQRLDKVTGKQKVDLLNALTYKLITHDNEKVIAYNKQALALSKSIDYLSGEARAYTYRGVFEYLTGQLQEGHRDLNHGLQLATRAGDKPLRGYIFLQLGNCSLEEVQMDSALIFFKQSREIFKDSTDPATLSKLYRNISALYGQRYQPDSQQIYLDRAIRIRRLLPDKALLIEALVVKANTMLMLGEFSPAQALVIEAKKILSSRPEDDENRNDIRRIEALILFQKGAFDQASVLFDSARNYFMQKSLFRKYVTLLIDLGTIFSERGDYELALNNLYDALKLSQLHHFDAESTIIRIQIGWVNHYLGNPEQALLMVNEAMRLSPKKLLRGDLANGLTLKGVTLTDLKKYSQSRACLDSVVQIYHEFGSVQGKSETLMHIGYLELQREKYAEALKLYTESIQLAEGNPNNYVLAWAYWGRGHACFKLGDLKNAVSFLNKSEEYAKRIGSNEVMVANYNTRRDLLATQNRFEEALHFSMLANQLKDSLRGSDVARRFVNLEKIQEIEQRNRDIRILQQDKLLAENKIQLQDDKLKQQSILLIGGLIGLLMLGFLALVYYRFYYRIKTLNVSIVEKNTRIQAQADKLQEVNNELNRLYNEVSEQKKEIQLQTDKLSESNQSILEMNRGLEKIVADKTVELRKINAELIKKNNELFQFSYTVSHNLRGPVARLLGLADLAEKENIPDQAKQLTDFIGETALELDQIVNDLIRILELRNEPQHHREIVSLEDEWYQTVGLLKDNLTGNEEISINFEALPEITTVRSLLKNILYNLLSNAIKFRSPERKLKVKATSRTQDGRAILEIADNGLGFNIELNHEKVFKLYRRFHAHVGGRGVGLYLIKTQVEVLHGSVEAISQPNKGSMFRVILPLSSEENLV